MKDFNLLFIPAVNAAYFEYLPITITQPNGININCFVSGDEYLNWMHDAHHYFQPYNATANPEGYTDDTDRKIREHQLLADAINLININSPVPESLDLDGDGDGYVNNVVYMKASVIK